MTPPLATTRLALVPLTLGDADALQRIFPRWETVKYLTARVPWPYPSDGAALFVRDTALPAMARGEQWHWTIRLREAPDAVIGLISLSDEHEANRGIWLDIPRRGLGFAREACACATEFWFATLGRPELCVVKAAENQASRRLSEHFGMNLLRIEERDFVVGRLAAEVWSETRAQWQARRAPK